MIIFWFGKLLMVGAFVKKTVVLRVVGRNGRIKHVFGFRDLENTFERMMKLVKKG